MASPGLFTRFSRGLRRSLLGQQLDAATAEHATIDAALLETVEEILITADLGVSLTQWLMQAIDNEIRYNRLTDPARMWAVIRTHLSQRLAPASGTFALGKKPTVALLVGVNGVGKTTTIGKLTALFRDQGHKVTLAAGDTFRAAAGDQLQIWGERLGADVIRHRDGADASAVAFDACQAAVARGSDLLLVDTAGRLHTNVNLMAELKKIHRVIGKVIPDAPHEVILVLDATTGQNAVAQARQFAEAVPVTGLVLTKLDSSAKGGLLVHLVDTLKCPVYFVGLGEGAEDLQAFDADAYLAALLPDPETPETAG